MSEIAHSPSSSPADETVANQTRKNSLKKAVNDFFAGESVPWSAELARLVRDPRTGALYSRRAALAELDRGAPLTGNLIDSLIETVAQTEKGSH